MDKENHTNIAGSTAPASKTNVGLTLDTNPQPHKKAKTTQTVAATAHLSSSGMTLARYLSNNRPKISLRVKTVVQLQITDLQDPKRVEHVIISGATDMKKLHHLLAFLTGSTPNYEYHSQRGSSVKGCRFELQVPGYKTCWITDAATSKQAVGKGADSVIDKSVKIVQVFQGLKCSANNGMVYDSDLAKTIATMAPTPTPSLVFVTSNGARFAVQVQAIAPTKAHGSKMMPMPRIVTYREGQRKSGFGLSLQQAKRILQGDRQDPKLILLPGTPKSETQKKLFGLWVEPICDLNGGNVCRKNLGEEHQFMQDFCDQRAWNNANVQSAGPPDSVAL